MKVAFIHTDFRIYWPARLTALTAYLNGKGIELQIIEIAGAGSHYDFSDDSESRPLNWHCLFPSRKMEDIPPAEANIALRKKLDDLLPDVVFAGAIAFPSGAAGIRWAVEHKRKVIIFDDARMEDVPRSWLVDYIKKRIYSCAHAVLCPSEAWDTTFTYFGFKEIQIFYGLDTVDNSFWQSDIISDKPYIGFGYILTAGRQIPKKNFLFLLHAYQRYTERATSPREIVMVGDGSGHDLLYDFVKQNRLNTITFVPFQSQNELKKLYRNAEYFILPSRHGETWGLVVNEAMASGLPVLVSNQAGCASTLVKTGENGYTFSPDNVNELAELLLKMDRLHPQDRKQMGEKSKTMIREWGLDRFCQGAYDAIQFVAGNSIKDPGLLTRLIIKLWKGRYRPV
jgi:glycosyltransferase involved in cell wall biosynthesis